MNLPAHLELYLGAIERGFGGSTGSGVCVGLFRDVPAYGMVTLATIGLSRYDLSQVSLPSCGQELLFVCEGDTWVESGGKMLLHIADEIRSRGRVLLRGETVWIGGGGVPPRGMDWLYASYPVVFNDMAELSVCRDAGREIIVSWLMPVFAGEAHWIKENGWEAFEDRMEQLHADVLNYNRERFPL